MSFFNVFVTVSIFYITSLYIYKVILKDYYKEMENKYNNILFSFIHEIKNPLSVVVGYLEIINKKDKYDIYKCLNIIDKEVNESLNIIEDYLMCGRFSMNFDYLDINLLLREVFLDFKKVEKAYGLDLNFYYDEEEVIVFGDYSKLKQVFVNIIKNSIEAKEQEKVMIDIDYRIIRNNIIIDFNDNGKGIKNTSLIGKDYYSTKENGNGIGSIFSKKILNLHNGDIKYISNGKKGCDVRINLPIVNI
jgi:two-component system sporulation sensor kinase B